VLIYQLKKPTMLGLYKTSVYCFTALNNKASFCIHKRFSLSCFKTAHVKLYAICFWFLEWIDTTKHYLERRNAQRMVQEHRCKPNQTSLQDKNIW